LIAFRKQKTVGDHLIRAILHPKPRGGVRTREPKPGFRKCGRNGGSGCILCHYSTPSTTHMASATGETFPITSAITYSTKNVIYDLWCNKCRNSAMANPGSEQYTGNTSGDGATRFSAHKSDVNNLRDKAVAQGFSQPGHSSADIRFLPFEVVVGTPSPYFDFVSIEEEENGVIFLGVLPLLLTPPIITYV